MDNNSDGIENDVKIMLQTHQYLLAASIITLTSYSFYAGVIAPILGYTFKLNYFSTGYTNDSKMFTIILSILFGLGMTLTFTFSYIYYDEVLGPNFYDFVEYFWQVCNYWSRFQQYQIPVALFWYIYGSLFFIALLNISFAFIARWDKNDDSFQQRNTKDNPRHAFIVVAHNSSSKLKKCIQSLLGLVEPHQIFIADNGSSSEERRKTKNICKRFSRVLSTLDLNTLGPRADNVCFNEQIPPGAMVDDTEKEDSICATIGSDKTGNSQGHQIELEGIEALDDIDGNLDKNSNGDNEGENSSGSGFYSCREFQDQIDFIQVPEQSGSNYRNFCTQMNLNFTGTKISNINVSHLDKGNKTFAQYATVCALSKWFDENKSLVDIVTILDDDVYVPNNFPFQDIEDQFQDSTKVAIAYPLNAENSNDNLCTAFQEVEYYSGNAARFTQDVFGSQLFCSGAIATWRISKLKDTLEKHCTTFNGEDLEMGYIVHKESKSNSNTCRIGFSRTCTVPTVVPYCWFHWYDFIPNTLLRKLRQRYDIQNCSCGEHSFFNQRLRSWDPANYQFFIKYAKVAFSTNGKKYGPKWFIRFVCIWKIIGILREVSLIVGILVPIFRIRNTEMAKVLFVFYADSVGIAWCIATFWTWCISFFSLSRMEKTLRPDIILWYPLFFEIPYMLIIRPISAIYSLAYYIYFQRFPKPLKTQLDNDSDLKQQVESTWNINNHLSMYN